MKGPKVWKDPSKEEKVVERALELCGRGGTGVTPGHREKRTGVPLGHFGVGKRK